MRGLITAAFIGLMPLGALAQDLSEADVKRLALEAILENPEIIREAIVMLEERREAEEAAAQLVALNAQRDLLENDPNAPVLGAADGDAVVVEFFDYNCPYCKRAADAVKTLMAEDEAVKVVYREWPILGEGSVIAARAALAAREQGKYEEMHWALMGLEGRATEASIMAAAREVGLDIDQLLADMESDAVTSHIQTSMVLAQSLGITGTPAFVIGDAVVPGAVPLSDLEIYVDEARQGG